MTAMWRFQGEKWWWIVREEKGVMWDKLSQLVVYAMDVCWSHWGTSGVCLCVEQQGGRGAYEFTHTCRDTHLGGCVSEASQFCKYAPCACFSFFVGMLDFSLFSPDDCWILTFFLSLFWWTGMFTAGFGLTKLSAMTWTGSCLCLYLRSDVWRQFALCGNWQVDGGSWRMSQRWCYCMTYCRQVQTTVGSALCT